MDQALSLPEIRARIFLFIRPHDYWTCALVSRAWFMSITPWLWHSATIHEMGPVEDLAILHKYRAFIRTLNFSRSEFPIEIYGWFDNLQALYFYFGKYRPQSSEHIADLVCRNRSSLQRIHVDRYCENNSIILRASHECLSLKHLYYGYLNLGERDLAGSFIKLCTRLTTLSLEIMVFEEKTHWMFKDQLFTSLEKLKMNSVNGPSMDFLRACPNLKVLSVYKLLHVGVEEFVEVITTHCKQLCVLDYCHFGFNTVGEFVKLALTMSPMKCLQVWFLDKFKFIPPSSYSRHYETLQAIRMADLSKKDGKDVHTILSSCPNLRWFFGDIIYAENIESGTPWVCQRLEHLQVEILVRDDDRRLDSAACAQLSQLKKLRTLDLSMPYWVKREDYQHRSLSLRLGEGLELLESLSELEHFGLGFLRSRWRAEWRTEDIEWMAQAWPNLEAVYGDHRKEDATHLRMCKRMGVSRVRKDLPFNSLVDFFDV